ncbi:MAG: EAL domain-containing protein [Candidatus Gracilibacteria bacterium]|nr:EAL domain-containing protein [Candidatus Gracilibacteria bacterium]
MINEKTIGRIKNLKEQLNSSIPELNSEEKIKIEKILDLAELGGDINSLKREIAPLNESTNIIISGIIAQINKIFGLATFCTRFESDCHLDLKLHEKIIEANPILEISWDLDSNTAQKVSKNIQTILGFSQEDLYLGEVKYLSFIIDEDRDRVREEIEKNKNNKNGEFLIEYKARKKNGDIVYISEKVLFIYNNNGEIINHYGYLSDISKQKELENEIKEKSYIDEKSGFPNMKKFKLDIKEGGIDTIVMLKINKFSEINTLYGNEIGDKILEKTIHYINNKLSKFDAKLYKIGELEIGIIFGTKNIDIDKIEAFLDKYSNVSIYCEITKQKIPVKFSIGSVLKEKEKDKIIGKCFYALYESKNKGIHVRFSEENYEKRKHEISKNKDIIKRIREAIKNDEIVPFFQGIRDNKTGKIEKYESLVRIHNTNETISPSEFLDQAKNAYLMGEITRIMIKKVIAKMSGNNYKFSINLTEHDLADRETIIFIKNTLENNYCVKADRLIIEVLEDITNSDDLIKNINELKELGIKIAIDDFGSGFSNFDRILNFSHDFLKIDGSLIRGVTKSNKKRMSVLKALVKISKITGAKLIAEFVETISEQKIVEKLGIHFSQGYLYSKPSKDLRE